MQCYEIMMPYRTFLPTRCSHRQHQCQDRLCHRPTNRPKNTTKIRRLHVRGVFRFTSSECWIHHNFVQDKIAIYELRLSLRPIEEPAFQHTALAINKLAATFRYRFRSCTLLCNLPNKRSNLHDSMLPVLMTAD